MRSHYVRAVLQQSSKGILTTTTTQCAICKRNFKHDPKPHDPEIRQRLWNALLDWDQEHGKPASIEKKRKRPRRVERLKEQAPAKVEQSPGSSSGGRDFLLRDSDADDSDVEVVDVRGPSLSFRLPLAHPPTLPQGPSPRKVATDPPGFIRPVESDVEIVSDVRGGPVLPATRSSLTSFFQGLPPSKAAAASQRFVFNPVESEVEVIDVRTRPFLSVPFSLTLIRLPGSFSSLWDPKPCDCEAFGRERLCACSVRSV
jgi:hypothetical protein